MPIATAKWQRRCTQRSFEQRARDKARLFGTPVTKPLHKKLRRAIENLPVKEAIFNNHQPLVMTSTDTGINYTLNGVPIDYYTAQDYYRQYRDYQARYQMEWNLQYLQQPIYSYQSRYVIPVNPNFNYTPTYYGSNTMPMSMNTQDVWSTWAGNNPPQMMTTYPGGNHYTGGQMVWTTWNENVNQRQLTRAEQAAQQALMATAERERQQRFAVAREGQASADRKALELFLHVLKPEERATYEKEKCIYVRGSRGRRYRIKCGHSQSHNVELLNDKGEAVSTLCAHPGEMVPNADCWMVQKLTLEHDEDHFIGTANFGGRDRNSALQLVPAA